MASDEIMKHERRAELTSLSEETAASLDAIVVHEREEYFLVEITSLYARERLDQREGFLDRLLSLNAEASSQRRVVERGRRALTQEMTTLERQSFVEACSRQVPVVLKRKSDAFSERPATDTWHPETSSRQLSTEEFARLNRVKRSTSSSRSS